MGCGTLAPASVNPLSCEPVSSRPRMGRDETAVKRFSQKIWASFLCLPRQSISGEARTRVALWPPKPKLGLRIARTRAARASPGT